MTKKINKYSQVMEIIFKDKYSSRMKEIPFTREDIERTALRIGIKNLGDIVYSFRYRTDLPEFIRSKAPEGMEWVIRPIGKSLYKFSLASSSRIIPNAMLVETKIPDATPGIIAQHALTDEQSLLAIVRYNRLIDIFSGVTCYSMQNHLRTTVKNMGQIEVDELYVGIDQRGAQYVFPVQAKVGTDKVGVVQIEQDVAMCAEKFPKLICKPIAAQFMDDNLIALFAIEIGNNGIAVSMESHYRLVSPNDMTEEDLKSYRNRKLSPLV